MKYPNIEAERARRGIKVADFVNLIGVSRRTYFRWQDGETDMPVRYLRKISSLIGCSSDYLIDEGGVESGTVV